MDDYNYTDEIKSETSDNKKRRGRKTVPFVFGWILIIAGISIVIVALIDYFISFSSLRSPSFFFLFFIGFPMIFIGAILHNSDKSRQFNRRRIDSRNNQDINSSPDCSSFSDNENHSSNCSSTVLPTSDKDTIICPFCHKAMPKASSYCPNCGRKIVKKTKTCPHCGEINDDDAIFCKSCGQSLL